MFDIGFSELILIGLVALIVIGPQRLPTVARTVGHLLGRLQRYVGDVKADISREMQLEELKKLQEQVMEWLDKFQQNDDRVLGSSKLQFTTTLWRMNELDGLAIDRRADDHRM